MVFGLPRWTWIDRVRESVIASPYDRDMSETIGQRCSFCIDCGYCCAFLSIGQHSVCGIECSDYELVIGHEVQCVSF